MFYAKAFEKPWAEPEGFASKGVGAKREYGRRTSFDFETKTDFLEEQQPAVPDCLAWLSVASCESPLELFQAKV